MGKMEYNYALCAARCGIRIPEVRLLPSEECPGFFAIKRFDREKVRDKIQRIHMASASGLLETSHRLPNLDYVQLMKLTLAITNDNTQLEELYRRMCFNVFAHNRDDHSKNFSFLCTARGQWSLSPAYDLTYSNSLAGEHATTVAGNGANTSLEDVPTVAVLADLNLE